jgi:pimeloyl-ACP methyl ester carboxylesterase
MPPPAQGSGASGRVDEGLFASINGVDQWLTLRGDDRANPALLILSGPGVAFSRLAPLFEPWERDYTLIQWDQPGAGATFARNGEAGAGPLSLDRLVTDAAAVIAFVQARLSVEKAIVLGISGGSVVGLMLAHRRPDLIAAYVGTGQFVNYARQDRLSYTAVLDRVRMAGDSAAGAELKALGAPPWPDAAADAVVSKHAGALTLAEQAVFGPAVMARINAPPPDAHYVARGLSEIDTRAQAMAAYSALRAELKAFDARRLGPRFEAPIAFIQGAEDIYSVTAAVEAYAQDIAAPRKGFSTIAGGGHSCVFMVDAFLAELNRMLRP